MNTMRQKITSLVQAASPLASTAMLKQLQDLPDNTPVQIHVGVPNGFRRWLTLGEYRRFVTELLEFVPD